MSDELPRGITDIGSSYRARLRVRGQLYSQCFKKTTPIADIEAWRRHTRADAERGLLPTAEPGTFGADAEKYLKAVAALPTIEERKRDIGLWIAEFGAQPRESIRPADIRAVRDRWLTVGPRMIQTWEVNPITGRKVRHWKPQDVPLSPSTVNHRLRALENLYTVLDGRHSPNPVRDVPEATEPNHPPRALPQALVDRILAAIPDSQAKAWIGVVRAIGLPPASIARMKPEMLHLDDRWCWVPGRLKGQGTAGRVVPLTEDGISAWRVFASWDAWKEKPPKGNMRKAWLAGCRKVQRSATEDDPVPDLSRTRVYDLRHSIAALAHLASGGDLESTRQLLGVSLATALRYASAALDPRLAAAVASLDAAQRVGRK